MYKVLLTLVLLISTSLPHVAVAQSAADLEMERQKAALTQMLSKGTEDLKSRGWVPSHRIHFGSLKQGTHELVTIELENRNDYTVIAMCDTDCTDLDLALLDPAGQVVAEDHEEDDYRSWSSRHEKGPTG